MCTLRFFSALVFSALATILLADWLGCSSVVAAEVSIHGEEILLDGQPTKVIGLRCSNSVMSEQTTDELIASLDDMRAYGLNTVSVFLMGSRFGDVAGYRPDGSMEPAIQNRLARVLDETARREMICIVGCLYWSTSRAKASLQHWSEADAARAIVGTAKWLAERGDRHVILDVDNEGMAARAEGWSTTRMIAAAHAAAPQLLVAANIKGPADGEDLNIHHSPYEPGKPWFDSEASPKAPGGYWGRFSKQTHQADPSYENYSRIGRYTKEMKADQLQQTRKELEQFAGYVFTSTWLQCAPHEDVGGPFVHFGGRSDLGTDKDPNAAWNQDIDTLHADAGILWWLEGLQPILSALGITQAGALPRRIVP